jgi:protein-L-isoaspartate(D-aspartate) O-methyltransferase
VPELAGEHPRCSTRSGYSNVTFVKASGYAGWSEHAPFDRIIVTAAPEQVPQTSWIGFRTPAKAAGYSRRYDEQWLTLMEKTTNGVTQRRTIPVRFVPLTRAQ